MGNVYSIPGPTRVKYMKFVSKIVTVSERTQYPPQDL